MKKHFCVLNDVQIRSGIDRTIRANIIVKKNTTNGYKPLDLQANIKTTIRPQASEHLIIQYAFMASITKVAFNFQFHETSNHKMIVLKAIQNNIFAPKNIQQCFNTQRRLVVYKVEKYKILANIFSTNMTATFHHIP